MNFYSCIAIIYTVSSICNCLAKIYGKDTGNKKEIKVEFLNDEEE